MVTACIAGRYLAATAWLRLSAVCAGATGAEFLGGIIAGFAADFMLRSVIADGLPRQYEGLKSIFIMPLIGVLGDRRDDGPARPAGSSDQQWHGDWLQLFTGSQPVLLGSW